MSQLLQTRRALGIQEWNDTLLMMDGGLIDPEYVLPSAVWALKDHPSLVVQMGKNRRWWCNGVVPGTGFQTDNESMVGYEDMIRANQWVAQVGLQEQSFQSKREALQALGVALDTRGTP